MTITQQVNRQIFTGNESNYEFAYARTVFDIDELTVVRYDTLTDTETVLNAAQYQVGYTGSPPYSSVTITYPLTGNPLTFDEQLIVYRNTVLSQEMDLTNQQAYFLESIETQLDRMAVINQNLQDQLNRAPLLPVSTPPWKQTFLGTPTPGNVLRWTDDPNDNILESVNLTELIVTDEQIRTTVEEFFADPLFTTAWTREFGDVSGGVVNTGFNADQVDGHDVDASTTPASGLLKVGDYGATLAALDVGAVDLNTLLSSGVYQSSAFTNGPAVDDWIVEVKRASATVVKQIAYNFYTDPEVYIRNWDGNTWTDWARMWGGIGGDGSGFNADQVDGHDVDSSTIPNSGLIKAGDWGATHQTLDFSGFNADAPMVVNFNGSNMPNAPDTGAWFIQALGDSAGLATQRAVSQSTGEVRHRWFNGSTWSSWTAAVTYDGHAHTESDITDLDKYTQAEVNAALVLKINSSLIGASSGICPLDASGLVDQSYLPSYVDDIIEVTSLPGTGEAGKIYVLTTDGNSIWRWTGAAFVEVNTSVGTADEAIALATARTISLGGDATGSASFDGTANITITANVLDSEALGGVAAANYLRSDVADTVGGVLTYGVAPVLNNNVLLTAWDTSPSLQTIAGINDSNQAVYGNVNLPLSLLSNGTHTLNGATVWTSANDGDGTALDAGLLGGALPAAYAKIGTYNTFTASQGITAESPLLLITDTYDSHYTKISRWNGNAFMQFYGNLYLQGEDGAAAGGVYLNDGMENRLFYHTGNDTNLAKLDSANAFTANRGITTKHGSIDILTIAPGTIITDILIHTAIPAAANYIPAIKIQGKHGAGFIDLSVYTQYSSGFANYSYAVSNCNSNVVASVAQNGSGNLCIHLYLSASFYYPSLTVSLESGLGMLSMTTAHLSGWSYESAACPATDKYELPLNIGIFGLANTFTANQTIESSSPGLILKETDTTTRAVFNQDGGDLYIQASGAGYTGGGNIRITGDSNSNISSFIVRYGGADCSVYHTGNDSGLLKTTGDKTIYGIVDFSNQVNFNSTYTVLRNSALFGVDGGGDSYIRFWDDNSNVYRNITWSNTNNDWYVHDNTGVDRLLYHAGNLSPLAQNAISGSFTTTDGKTITVVNGQITAITT
jgi:hypothetical protein